MARGVTGTSQADLAECVGITTAAISNLEVRDAGTSRHSFEIAVCLGVDPNWLVTGNGSMNLRAPKQIVEVPLISWVQAGDWAETNDPYVPGDGQEWVSCPSGVSKSGFALTVTGESMEPDFKDGDVIVVDPEIKPRHGDNVVVRLHSDNTSTFKRLVIEGEQTYLRAINPNWPSPIIEVQGDATISGVVVSRTSNFR